MLGSKTFEKLEGFIKQQYKEMQYEDSKDDRGVIGKWNYDRWVLARVTAERLKLTDDKGSNDDKNVKRLYILMAASKLNEDLEKIEQDQHVFTTEEINKSGGASKFNSNLLSVKSIYSSLAIGDIDNKFDKLVSKYMKERLFPRTPIRCETGLPQILDEIFNEIMGINSVQNALVKFITPAVATVAAPKVPTNTAPVPAAAAAAAAAIAPVVDSKIPLVKKQKRFKLLTNNFFEDPTVCRYIPTSMEPFRPAAIEAAVAVAAPASHPAAAGSAQIGSGGPLTSTRKIQSMQLETPLSEAEVRAKAEEQARVAAQAALVGYFP
jgi:hypothetical protein